MTAEDKAFVALMGGIIIGLCLCSLAILVVVVQSWAC